MKLFSEHKSYNSVITVEGDFTMNGHERIFAVLLTLIMIVSVCACSNTSSTPTNVESEANLEEFELRLVIDYEANLLFAKYDIDIFIDSEKFGTVVNGSSINKTQKVKEGSHEIKLINSGDSSVYATLSIEMDNDKVLSFSVKTHESSIDIKNQKEKTKEEYEKSLIETEPTTEKLETSTSSISEAEFSDYVGMKVVDAIPLLEGAGYSVTYVAENTGMDFTESFHLDPELAGLYIIRKVEVTGDNSLKVIALSKEMFSEQESQKSLEDKLNENLDEYIAWAALTTYGKSIYGKKFKIHYIVGKLAATPEDEYTWFLKAECTLPSGVGTIVEGRVTGTSDNNEVTYFYVY